MCGISGFFKYNNSENSSILDRMNNSLSHRGPDGEGIFIENGVGLAHRRLAIIDLNTGAQPMHSSDERYVTVFNGEIYNYIELRQELERLGSTFKTNSDTEVIAESIRIWHIDESVKKFRGMFAFAVYDKKENVLYLARDRCGIKPLYWAKKDRSFFFASEIKALLHIPDISKKADCTGLNDYLTLGFPIPPRTCWKDIINFPPAHYAIVKEDGNPELHRYWKWGSCVNDISEKDAEEKAMDILSKSLKYHVRSDVPIGSYLSGGIDSSLLVFLLKQRGIVENLNTYNVKFTETEYDESKYAQLVSRICGTNHHTLELITGSPDIFENILAQYDEPFGDSSCLPTYLLSAEMRKHVKTVISGDGGDELFGGYERIRHASAIYKLKKLPLKSLLSRILSLNNRLIGIEKTRKYRKAIAFSNVELPELFCLLHTYFTEEDKINLCSESFLRSTDDCPTWTRMNSFMPEDHGHGIETIFMGLEFNLNLHMDYLRKVDIASSAHGLEVRVPFLDNEVIDFASALPLNFKIRSKTCKYLLREIVKKNLSSQIGVKAKQGFGIPFDSWCKGPMNAYIKELLFSTPDGVGIWNIFNNRKSLLDLFEKFSSISSSDYDTLSRYQIYQRIFMLCGIQLWFKKFNPEL